MPRFQFLTLVGQHVVNRAERLAVRDDRQAEASNQVQEFEMGRKVRPLPGRLGMGQKTKPPLDADPRVEQLKAAGRRVARVGEEAVAAPLLHAIQLSEPGVRQIDFAAYFEQFGSPAVRSQPQGNVVDRP